MLSHRALLCRRCGCRCGHDGRRLGERYHGTDANPASVTIVVGGEIWLSLLFWRFWLFWLSCWRVTQIALDRTSSLSVSFSLSSRRSMAQLSMVGVSQSSLWSLWSLLLLWLLWLLLRLSDVTTRCCCRSYRSCRSCRCLPPFVLVGSDTKQTQQTAVSHRGYCRLFFHSPPCKPPPNNILLLLVAGESHGGAGDAIHTISCIVDFFGAEHHNRGGSNCKRPEQEKNTTGAVAMKMDSSFWELDSFFMRLQSALFIRKMDLPQQTQSISFIDKPACYSDRPSWLCRSIVADWLSSLCC